MVTTSYSLRRILLTVSSLRRLLLAAAGFVLLFANARAQNAVPDERQIFWQRNLDDALAIAKAENRPLLLAVNMDGESASERIIREEYRDPAFVASTRQFVCVMASVFRHTPRDYDDNGKRIPCPRLGEVTCGEHMALEEVLWDKYLSDGERVAPRHAVVMPDGTKPWDVFLAWDLRDIDRELALLSKAELDRRAVAGFAAPGWLKNEAGKLGDLAGLRTNRGRASFEEHALASDGADDPAVLAAVRERGDAGSIGVLRIVTHRAARGPAALRDDLAATASAVKLEPALADALRDELHALGRFPGTSAPDGVETLLPLLARLDGKNPVTRSFVLGCRAMGEYGAASDEALRIAFGNDAATKIARDLDDGGGAFALTSFFETVSSARPAVVNEESKRAAAEIDAMQDSAPAEQLERDLATLERELKDHSNDAEITFRYGRTALDLARKRVESKSAGVKELLEDAAVWLRKSADSNPHSPAVWIELARTSYYLGEFSDEAPFGVKALEASLPASADVQRWRSVLRQHGVEHASDSDALTIATNAYVVESLRWIGDGNARLMADRSGKDPSREALGLMEAARSLAIVVCGPFASGDDWVSLASVFGAVGMWREEFAILQQGALRFPASQALRERVNSSLMNVGRVDLVPVKADWIASRNDTSADAQWFAGYAWILAGENHRRREEPDLAITAYTTAELRFASAMKMKPDYADSSKHWIGRTWLGRGMAHLLANRQAEAAQCLVRGVASHIGVALVRDNLDREAIDLLDQALEWRASGPSSVDPMKLLAQLEQADPNDPYWPISVSDSELREGLRADGRNPVKSMQDTVDAEGKPIRMEMGVPNEEGDAYLIVALQAARRGVAMVAREDTQHALAQVDTIWAERMLGRERIDEVRKALAEAAPSMGLEAPKSDADRATLAALTAQLRAMLGPARPKLRQGR